MAGINVVVVAGNLTRDSELKATKGGTPVLGFGIAVSERTKDPETGEWSERPNYFDCVMFGDRAEPVSRYLRKGTKATIKGRLRYSSWMKDDERRSKVEIVAEDIDFSNKDE